MTDIRRVISVFSHPSRDNTTNYVKSPEGDRHVCLNRFGCLELDSPPVLSTIRHSFVATAEEARLSSSSLILDGDYFDADITLQPSDVDYRRLLIRVSDIAANRALTLPQPNVLINHLKNVCSPENVVAGLSWSVVILNDSEAGFTVNVTAPAAGAGLTFNRYGFAVGGPPNIRAIVPKLSARFLFVLTNVTPGAEGMSVYALNG